TKVPSKLFLGHLDFLTNRPDIEMLRDEDAVLTRAASPVAYAKAWRALVRLLLPAFDIASDSSSSLQDSLSIAEAPARNSGSGRYSGAGCPPGRAGSRRVQSPETSYHAGDYSRDRPGACLDAPAPPAAIVCARRGNLLHSP